MPVTATRDLRASSEAAAGGARCRGRCSGSGSGTASTRPARGAWVLWSAGRAKWAVAGAAVPARTSPPSSRIAVIRRITRRFCPSGMASRLGRHPEVAEPVARHLTGLLVGLAVIEGLALVGVLLRVVEAADRSEERRVGQ